LNVAAATTATNGDIKLNWASLR